MDNLLEILAKNIRQLMFDARISSQLEFSKKVGIQQTALNSFLNCKMPNPTIKTLENIAKPFGKDVVWLLTDHSNEAKDDTPSIVVQAAKQAYKEAHGLVHVPDDILDGLRNDCRVDDDFRLIRSVLRGIKEANEEAKDEQKTPHLPIRPKNTG